MTTITTTLPLPTCRRLREAEAEAATGVATLTHPTTTVTMTTMTIMAMTITTIVAAMTTPITATTTSRAQAEGAVEAGARGGEPLHPGDVAAQAHLGAGPASPNVAGQDQAVAGVAQEEECSREGEEGYVVRGVAAVEM